MENNAETKEAVFNSSRKENYIMENNAETREGVFNSPNLDGYYVTVDPDGLHPGTIDGDIILGLTDTDGADFVVRIDCRTAKQLSKSLKAAVTMSKLNNKINC